MMGTRMREKRHIYLASSWRNPEQPAVVTALRDLGHEVYDFRHPRPGDDGFSWRQVDPQWQRWTPEDYVTRILTSDAAAAGFISDHAALDWCDTCVLLLPCGRSAHLEAGYVAGQGKRVIVWLSATEFQPELMYLMCDHFVFGLGDLVNALSQPD